MLQKVRLPSCHAEWLDSGVVLSKEAPPNICLSSSLGSFRFAKALGSLDPRPLFTCIRARSPRLPAGACCVMYGDLEDADFDQREATGLQIIITPGLSSVIGVHFIHLIQP